MKVKMSDNSMTNNLQAPVFSGKEEEWPEFIVKFQAFLATKGCTEAIQTNFKSKWPTTEDEEFDASTKLVSACQYILLEEHIPPEEHFL